MHLPPLLLPLLPALHGLAAAAAQAKPRDAILLSQVESLTLRGGRPTAHRRVPAIPQLKCVSARAVCARFAVDLMRCENKGAGYDAEDIQWSCTAQLPPELKLASTDVICEGYSSPDDPYVLKGSCGVEYRLMLTPAGEAKWPDLAGGAGGGGGDRAPPTFPSANGIFPVVFWLVFGAVALVILVRMFCAETGHNNDGGRPAPRFNGGGGGGGGGGDGGDGWDDPPPPYNGSGRGSGGSRKSNWSGLGGTGGGSNWASNLASGAAGAAAGYYAGSRGRNNNMRNTAPNYGSTWGDDGGEGSSSSGSSGSSSGTARHESTGFGSTSRR